jgi:spermidine/putrescine transport system substrate-binding protein
MNDHVNRPLDPALMRGLTRRRLDRRDMLRLLAGVGGAAALSACGGIEKQGNKADTSASAVEKYWKAQKETGRLNWAHWSFYLDEGGKKTGHPTLDQFEQETGIKVKFVEAVTDNGPFFAKVQPTLSSGQYCGYDLAVITSGIYFNKFKDLGFLVPLDKSRLPNFDKYVGDKYKDPNYDPDNVYSTPWQAGFTGIGYNPTKTGREITTWQDLADPKFKGHIGMMANTEDLPNIALLAIGKDPHKSTEKDWEAAADWITKMKPLVRNFYSQDYINGLASGDVWISMAWSGDVFQQNLSGKKTGSQLKFVIPDEGGLIWTDNFVILKGAQNPISAMQLMDFYQQPKVAAEVTEYNNYISPVPAAQDIVKADAAKAKGEDKAYLEAVATSYATFPEADTYEKVSAYFTPKAGAELEKWNSIFEPVYQS